MASINLTRSRIFGIGLATAALAFAACGHSNSTPTGPSPSPSPVEVVTAGPTSPPCSISIGIAYEPDAGNGNGFTGIQQTHYEGNSNLTCGNVGPTAVPTGVRFADSVGEFAISAVGADGNVDAVAVEKNGVGGYSLVQDVFGAAAGTLVPAGAPYDASVPPPTATPSAGATSSATAGPVIPDITSVETVSGGANGLAVVVGPAATPAAIVAITSLENAPPIYGDSVSLQEPTATYTGTPGSVASIVRLAPASTSSGSPALVRSATDLVSYNVTNATVAGYQFDAKAHDSTLGTGTAMRGKGNISFSPADPTKALIGGTSAGDPNTLTEITGLPNAITLSSTLEMPGAIHSVEVAANGVYAIVGTSVGIVVVTGVDSAALTVVTPFSKNPSSPSASAISYTNCNGVVSLMTDIYSLGFGQFYAPVSGSTTNVNQFLVALGTAPGVTCPSGYNATLVAIPFNPTIGGTPVPTTAPTATAAPTLAPGASPTPTASPSPPAVFVQNNMIAPPAGSDVLVVK